MKKEWENFSDTHISHPLSSSLVTGGQKSPNQDWNQHGSRDSQYLKDSFVGF